VTKAATQIAQNRSPVVAIIGAGMSGLYMAARLKMAGIERFTVFEKAASVGGVWRDNHYPGLTCDVPSRYYSFHFELNPDWSSFFASHDEIWGYFDEVARKYGLMEHIRFGKDVESAEFVGGRWHLRTADGDEMDADFVITACGTLRRPHLPDIKGLESFAGPKFHSVDWDRSLDVTGKRIAIVGTGSTGVQLVGALAPVAGKLYHFQRTPQWIFPMPNRPYSTITRRILRRVPALNRLSFHFWRRLYGTFTSRLMVEEGIWRKIVVTGVRLNLRLGVRDPALRRRLTPTYPVGCKRIVMSAKFYRAIQRPTVEVVTDRIERVVPSGIVTADGVQRDVDMLVLATGFHAQSYVRPLRVIGQGGADLDAIWGDVPRAYQTIAQPHFPNFFMMSGPHNPLGNQAVTHSARLQSRYIMRWIRMYMDGVYDVAAPTAAAAQAFNDEIDAAYPNDTVWASGCESYYLGKDGRPSVWPWRAERYVEMLANPAMGDFELRHDARTTSESDGATAANLRSASRGL
jgi:cation diffusion facilitator CzcD-associated flavoprotein CzcO